MNDAHKITMQSLGAAQTVTGSKHLLRTPELTLLVDCGLFQGIKTLREKNWEDIPVNPAEVDALILTHAHLDHCGYIPLFVKRGFRGKIYMTPPTSDLAELILYDSAKIQVEDAERANRMGFSKHHPALPLYDEKDVDEAIPLFQTVEHSIEYHLSPNLSFHFRKNGHILGAASAVISCYGKKIVFSGDIGRYESRFLLPPSSIPEADLVVMESTYGDRLHGDNDPLDELAEVINRVIKRHGSLVIPSFAVGRAQEIMHLVNTLKHEERIPASLPVFLDSPMAANATQILCRHTQWHKLKHDECMSVCNDVVINREFRETKKIIATPGSKIVISASGMLTGGRVLEYLKYLAPDPKNAILLIGYQAEGTRGRRLKNGEPELKIHGQFVPVKASVEEISGLSGHADQSELLQWLGQMGQSVQKVILVHGESPAQEIFRAKIEQDLHIPAQIAKEDEEITLFNL
ncbi:MAG: MBL fold metallo-hydrolase [Chitinophagales bacterium]|nr:MBL fold metallo-hydrolase [Chitinophagales bacterium]